MFEFIVQLVQQSHDIISVESLRYLILGWCMVLTGFSCVATLGVVYAHTRVVQHMPFLRNIAAGAYLFQVTAPEEETPLSDYISWLIASVIMLGVVTNTFLAILGCGLAISLFCFISFVRFRSLEALFKDERYTEAGDAEPNF